jgi:hypothetical protein
MGVLSMVPGRLQGLAPSVTRLENGLAFGRGPVLSPPRSHKRDRLMDRDDRELYKITLDPEGKD